jgi:hypothetical protein
MIDLDKLLELEAKATTPPWNVNFDYSDEHVCLKNYEGHTDIWHTTLENGPDTKLISAMRNSIRELCIELKAAREVIEKGRGAANQRSDAPYAAGQLYYPEFYEALKKYDEARRG